MLHFINLSRSAIKLNLLRLDHYHAIFATINVSKILIAVLNTKQLLDKTKQHIWELYSLNDRKHMFGVSFFGFLYYVLWQLSVLSQNEVNWTAVFDYVIWILIHPFVVEKIQIKKRVSF